MTTLFQFAFVFAVFPSSLLLWDVEGHRSCDLVKVAHGYACRCNETYCDDVPALAPSSSDGYSFVLSTESGKRLEVQEAPPLDGDAQHDRRIVVDASKAYQSIKGFGNAYTDAAAINFGIAMVSLVRKYSISCLCWSRSAIFKVR